MTTRKEKTSREKLINKIAKLISKRVELEYLEGANTCFDYNSDCDPEIINCRYFFKSLAKEVIKEIRESNKGQS